MKQEPMIAINTFIRQDQRRQLMAISTRETVFAEHIRRALDIYLSQPSIQEGIQ